MVTLALLAQYGPRHGHQLRRDVEVTHADEWAGIGAGSLHRELVTLLGQGLTEVVRTEKAGSRPERTIYAITAEGRRELDVLLSRAVGKLGHVVDAVSAGLIFSAAVVSQERVRRDLQCHRQQVVAEVERLRLERDRGIAQGYLDSSVSPSQAAAFRRAELHAEAEMTWHQECDSWFGAQTNEASSELRQQ